MVDTGGEDLGPAPRAPEPPSSKRRRWIYWVSILVMLVIGLPAAILACLAREPGTFDLRLAESELDTLDCPSKDVVFPDCYATVVASLSHSQQPTGGFIDSCCSFLGDRRLAVEVWLNFANSATILSETGTTALGVVKTDGGISSNIPISVSRAFERVLPWAEQFFGQRQSARILALMDGWALRMPPQLLRYWPKDEAVADKVLTISAGRPRVEVNAFSDGTKHFQISVKTDIARTILFPESVSLNSDLSELGARLTHFPLPSPMEIAARLQELATSANHQSMDATVLTKAAMTIQTLGGTSVSRISRVSEVVDKFKAAGTRCVNLYRDLRGVLSRLDAALATYATTHATGLLLRHPGERDHGCTVAGSVFGAELDRAWQLLRLNLPTLTDIDLVKEQGPISTNDTRSLSSYLLTIASAAKSGARHADLVAGFYPEVDVRVGRNGAIQKRDRSQVLRLLHRQWTHVGCWLHHKDTFSLHAEAQFPYLNNLTFRRGRNGLVTAVNVTGVTFAQLEQIRRINRGANCQAFLNPTRMKLYQNWLSDGSTDARTPVDHAQRLLETGPQKRFHLPIR